MIPGKFDYLVPQTLAEAVSLLDQYGDGAKILAGGQSLIPAMRFRLAVPEVLIDLNHIGGLSYIREENGYLTIGAMTREAEIDESELIKQKYTLLADTARVIADPLVRNMATVGGNLAHADPANEILKEIRIPTPPAHEGGAYIKLERKVGDYAVAAVAVQLGLAGEVCQSVRIGLTNVSAKPMRATGAEAALLGKPLTEENLKAAGLAASQECEPSADLRGSEAYKRDLVRVVTMRAIRQAEERARRG